MRMVRMRKTRRLSLISWVLVPALALLAMQGDASAGGEPPEEEAYASYECASDKMQAAAQRCGRVLRAWSMSTRTGRDPQGRIDRADEWFDKRWTRAEEDAAQENVDCVDMTLSGDDMKQLMDSAIEDIVADVTAGLNLNKRKHALCGARLLRSTASMCARLLRSESRYIGHLSEDPDGLKLDAMQARTLRRFGRHFDHVTRRHCPTDATKEEIQSDALALADEVVTQTIVSPNVPDDAFMAITHPAGGEPGNPVSYEGDTLVPQCQDSSAFTFFAKRGSVNKTLMYYVGGGACWDTLTCVLEQCTQNVNPTPPGLTFYGGFGDLTHPDNPFKDWNIVIVPYCGCDIHLGDNAVDYPPFPQLSLPGKHVEHRGYDNAKLAEKWAREHFLNPTDMFVTGSSAGSYGAMVHGAHLSEAYVATSINVMGDGGNGVATQEFMDVNFNNWGAMENLPDVPGIIGVPSNEMSIPLILKAAASHFPDTNWSNYTTAFDGGTGGQTGFYNIMLNPYFPPVWGQWWNASCLFNEAMREQAFDTYDTAALENDNYRYYIASGSYHTGFGNPRIYDDTTGGVPPLVDWVNAMMDDDPSWTNVEADPFNVLFPDDPRPDPLQLPFEMVGSDVVISCE